MEREISGYSEKNTANARILPVQGWLGLALIAIFWAVNWLGSGPRTAYAFFPLWLGYICLVDGINVKYWGTSLITRSMPRFIGLFLMSAPVWWLFESLNQRLHNWEYLGVAAFTPLQYFLLASLNFSVVMPAVFESAELASHARFLQRLKPGPRLPGNRKNTLIVFFTGWVCLGLLLLWPRYFFPLVWLSVYFILEPVNVWLGFSNLTRWTGEGDWRPVIGLFVGVLLTGFFWEMWNYYSFPKWVYHVPSVDFWRIFEMPILGYGGYLPFSLELSAVYHLVGGILGQKEADLWASPSNLQ